MKLHYRRVGTGSPIIILHGLFGSGDNWQNIAKSLSENHEVILVDQRNHGNSPHSKAFNYDLLADDLNELMLDLNIGKSTIIGHSMGGKTAMNFAVKNPDKVEKMIIVDIGPKHYPPHHDEIFEGFQSVNLTNLQSRKEADDQLASKIPELGVRMFILKNLSRNKDNSFEWKVNLSSLELNIEEVGRALKTDAIFNGSTLFIGGSNSNYIGEKDLPLIKKHFPNAEVKMIHGAGHWVHAEQPAALLSEVTSFMNQ